MECRGGVWEETARWTARWCYALPMMADSGAVHTPLLSLPLSALCSTPRAESPDRPHQCGGCGRSATALLLSSVSAFLCSLARSLPLGRSGLWLAQLADFCYPSLSATSLQKVIVFSLGDSLTFAFPFLWFCLDGVESSGCIRSCNQVRGIL